MPCAVWDDAIQTKVDAMRAELIAIVAEVAAIGAIPLRFESRSLRLN